MPDWKSITGVQQDTTAGNLATIPGAESLAGQVNAFQQSELDKQLENSIPGYNGLIKQLGANLMSQARGELPKEVQDLIKRTTAEGALAGGYQGSQVANFASAKNLGLTSLNLMQSAQDSFTRWIQTAKSTTMAPMMDITSMFLTPQQRLGIEDSRTQTDFLAQIRNASIKAAPDPFKSALTQAMIHDENQIMSMVGSLGGLLGGAA